jgi:hypothetical protein
MIEADAKKSTMEVSRVWVLMHAAIQLSSHCQLAGLWEVEDRGVFLFYARLSSNGLPMEGGRVAVKAIVYPGELSSGFVIACCEL